MSGQTWQQQAGVEKVWMRGRKKCGCEGGTGVNGSSRRRTEAP